MPVNTTPRQQVHDFVQLRLGAGMVDVELDPEHYDSALDFALAFGSLLFALAFASSFSFLGSYF